MKQKIFLLIFVLLGTFGVINGQAMYATQNILAEPGKTYSYDFTDGSVFPKNNEIPYDTFVSEDGILTVNRNTGSQFRYHNEHGIITSSGNSIGIVVAGNAVISFGNCEWSAKDAIFIITDASGNELDRVQAVSASGACSPTDFYYTGAAGVITATLSSSNSVYIHGITIKNEGEEEIIESNGKIDVWDFGAAQFDEDLYNNHLNEDVINSWYPGVDPGTTGIPLSGGFTAGILTWVGGNNDRIRTSNTNLTRYDEISNETYEDEVFTGSLYVNAESTSRYLSLKLNADDEVTVYAKLQNSPGQLTFEAEDGTQNDFGDISKSVSLIRFVAKKAGTYRIYDGNDKPFYYRILRKEATYVTVSGSINTDAASGLSENYTLIFTNEAGKQFTTVLTSGSTNYSIEVPAGYTYKLSLENANGFIIVNGNSISIEEDITHDIVIAKVELKTLLGAITGLDSDYLKNLELIFTPEDEELIYVPEPVIDVTKRTYTVELEPETKYIISANGVNDYYIPNDEITISADSISDIVFVAKPTYQITITPTRLETEHISKLSILFENLNEPGYVYTFTSLSDIYLRDGVCAISCEGLDEYQLELAPTSNLTVSGGQASKNIEFIIINNWSFEDKEIINGETTAYKGMLFAGKVYNESNKGHLVIEEDATVKVPVNPGEKLIITYYYSANFSIEDGDPVQTSSGSTSQYETVEYIYSGTSTAYVTITNISGRTYITNVQTVTAVEYASAITVGTDKEYQTINEALAAVRAMSRPNKERVKIMIDPGNYEEMLVIDVDSVSFINSAASPGIGLLNQGVDIEENAVRITGYYGHGYDYYSMGTDQKWNEDALRVNKENGYIGYHNVGSGTTNASYWNATVVISAPGFEASYIIFENSFNQYISKKESEDVVVEWTSEGKCTRPTEYGSTEVQNKSFVERAAAIAYTASADKSILYYCRVVGRQDSFYGAEGMRVVVYKGSLMGGTDYLFGGMTLIAYQSDLAMNTSESSSDVSYLTAAQQSSARGYLLYECTVTSAQPGTETASVYLSKPGYFGRPWMVNTSEVVFYNTTIKATDNPNYSGKSMIDPAGWNSSLSGTSDNCYEYGTIEESGEDNSGERVSWTHILSTPVLNDGTEITTFNFTKGDDNWDPIPGLIEIDDNDGGGTDGIIDTNSNELSLIQVNNTIEISGIKSATTIAVYNVNGTLSNNFTITDDTYITLKQGFWIIKASNSEGQRILKVLVP